MFIVPSASVQLVLYGQTAQTQWLNKIARWICDVILDFAYASTFEVMIKKSGGLRIQTECHLNK